jgi:hypothetical protein
MIRRQYLNKTNRQTQFFPHIEIPNAKANIKRPSKWTTEIYIPVLPKAAPAKRIHLTTSNGTDRTGGTQAQLNRQKP